MISFEDALERLTAAAKPLAESEEVGLAQARGRVLATALFSPLNVPRQDNSAMDGYAVRSSDVPVSGTRLVVSQRIAAGSVGHFLAPGSAARIFTGAPIPDGADAVVVQEHCMHDGDSVVFNQVPKPDSNIRRAGEDIRRGSEVLAAGVRLGSQHLGLAASVGIARLPVYRRLRVALFSTGDELTPPGEPLPPGAIYNSNRFFLQALLEQLGCDVADLGIIPDRIDETRVMLRQAAFRNDLIITSGGVSVGEEDHVKPAVQAEGELQLWKIAIKPGKPLAFGRVGSAAFIGLPGNPVSAFVTFLMLVRPFILKCQGVRAVEARSEIAEVKFDWPKSDVRRDFLRVKKCADGRFELFSNQSSAVLTSTVWADGLISVPPGATLRVGERAEYFPFAALV
jgi:molybdopterin molybdotransferase